MRGKLKYKLYQISWVSLVYYHMKNPLGLQTWMYVEPQIIFLKSSMLCSAEYSFLNLLGIKYIKKIAINSRLDHEISFSFT